MSDMESTILRIVEKWWADLRTERHGLVTSYDPQNHLAKVTFQPEGQESGWLPIETGHIGNGYGIATGLQPGDGKTTGDQVVVRYQEGDLESGKVVQRVHSDDQKPPVVQSGETVIWTRFKKSDGGSESAQGAQGGTGQQIYLKNDGSLMMTDGNGATIVNDGKGNIAITTSGNTTITTQGDTDVNATGNVNVTGSTIVTNGPTHLGAAGGVQIAKMGTIDTGGFADICNLATKVFAT
jgi:hypothetical protein